MISNDMNDLKFALRQLRKSPGFTFVAVLTLAIGIGANTTIFSALNALLLRPLPIEDPEELTSGYAMREGVDPYLTSLLEYAAYRERSQSFANSGVGSQRFFNLVVLGEPQRLRGAAVTADYLGTLGVKTVSGRLFRPEEDRPGGSSVAAISYELWQRLFGGDPGIIGRPVNFEEGTYTVIGILDPGFNMPFAADIWIPLQVNIEALPLEQSAQRNYHLIARLKPGVKLSEADAELKGIARNLEQEYPQLTRGWSYKLISLRQDLIGDLQGRTRKVLFALVAAVGLVLLICCANLANLLLARGVAREREISIRFALGAGRSRIVRQLLTESLLLAFLGGVAGLILAYWIAPLLGGLSPVQTVSLANFLRDFRIDAHVLEFCFVLSLFTAAIFGFIPALKVIRSRDLITIMKQGEHRAGGAFGGKRLLDGLVVAEIAVAATLLVAGSLLVQSFQSLQRIKLGFRPDNLLLVELALSPNKYREHRQRVVFAEQMLERIKALPGVVSACTTTNFPLQLFDSVSSFTVEGRFPSSADSVPMTIHRLVSPDYFKTLGIRLLEGRPLTEQDTAQSLPVVVINMELARQAWPGEKVIGKRIRRGSSNETNFPWLTVVGVIENIKEDRFNFRADRPAGYLRYAQQESTNPLQLIVRASSRPADLIVPIRHAIHSLDPSQPISNITTMKDYLAEVLMKERFSAILMGTLAAIGLTLAVVGLYGVMAYSVGQRTGEIGLRMALGARSGDILRLVFRHGVTLTACGLLVGLFGAGLITRALSETLYEINPTDPFTFILVAVVLASVTLLACYIPARRATHVDPMVALRCE
jgi:putative ABC transport system permease protein